VIYEPGRTKHGLSRDPFKSCVIPRPIGWISTISKDGVSNLAPFSQFQNVSFDPPYVMMCMATEPVARNRKDTVTNIEATREFVWNMATYDLREAVVISAKNVPPDVDEFDLAGVTKENAQFVKPFRVAESPVHFECTWYQTIRLPMGDVQDAIDMVIGKVIAVHVKDDFIRADGRLDVLKMRPLARLGYHDYTSIDSVFELESRDDNPLWKLRMEGAAIDYRDAVGSEAAGVDEG
jgi:flavin reductase (DIM6/NTAB) family NADH-FMN oxidoreductase RutF